MSGERENYPVSVPAEGEALRLFDSNPSRPVVLYTTITGMDDDSLVALTNDQVGASSKWWLNCNEVIIPASVTVHWAEGANEESGEIETMLRAVVTDKSGRRYHTLSKSAIGCLSKINERFPGFRLPIGYGLRMVKVETSNGKTCATVDVAKV